MGGQWGPLNCTPPPDPVGDGGNVSVLFEQWAVPRKKAAMLFAPRSAPVVPTGPMSVNAVAISTPTPSSATVMAAMAG